LSIRKILNLSEQKKLLFIQKNFSFKQKLDLIKEHRLKAMEGEQFVDQKIFQVLMNEITSGHDFAKDQIADGKENIVVI
jgi:hypothetical protein